MKKIGFLLMIVFCLLLSGCNKKNTLTMVTEAGFAPYEYYLDGKIVGVDVDIANEIAKDMGKKLIIKDVAFDSIINEIKSGKADFGAAGISYNEERALEVDFSINYAKSKQVVIVKENSNIKKPEEIAGKKVAVQLGTVADTYISETYKDTTLIREKKFLAAIEDLKNNKVEAVVMDELPAKKIIDKNIGLIIIPGYLLEDSYGMIVKKGNEKLKKSIDKVLNRLIAEGKIDEYIISHS